MSATQTALINGIDTERLQQVMEDIKADHRRGIAKFHAKTQWKGNGPKSETRISYFSLGGERLPRNFTIMADEPQQLLGTNTAANPQEYLFVAMNSCLLATFVAASSVQGIKLDSLEIETEGELDLRGFLGLDKNVIPGYDHVNYTIRVKGDGTEQQFKAVHEFMKKTSPNYFNMATAISLNSKLVVN